MKNSKNNENKNKMKLGTKIALISLSSVLGITLLGGITVFSLWHNEIATVNSIKLLRERNDAHRDGNLYEMTVSGDYYFQDFIDEGGVKSDKELISFVTQKITKGLIPMKLEESEIACSAYTATLENGDKVFGRNYDFKATNTCIVKTNPSHGYKSVSTVDLQFIGLKPEQNMTELGQKISSLAAPFVPLDGINEKGVSCGIFMTYQGDKTVATDQKTDKPDITSTTMLRLILDYASSVEEAVKLVEKYDLHDSANTSYHYMVADASGKSAILEWVGETDLSDNDGSKRKLVVTYNDNDSNIGTIEAESSYQWITNFIIQPDYYEDDSKKAGLDRYMQIYGDLKEYDGVLPNEEKAMEVLKNVGRRSFGTGSNGSTIHSVVYNLTKKTSYFVSNENYDDPTAKFHYSVK